MKEGVRDGEGVLEWSNGDKYEGEFKNGLRHGHGVLIECKGSRRYEGQWVLSQKEGKGTETFANGDKYVGDFSADVYNGQGELRTKGGVYTGHFKDGLRDGIGLMQFKSNCRYEGHWQRGRFHGRGLYIWSDGRKYEGNWENGERNGMGILTLTNGEKYGKHLIFIASEPPILALFHIISLTLLCCNVLHCTVYGTDGSFVNNKMHGAGWWKFAHGKVRPGEWKNDELLRWTGPEQFEAQMKAKRLRGKPH